MISLARFPIAVALPGALALAACGNDLDSRNEAAMSAAPMGEQKMTIRSQPQRTSPTRQQAQPAPDGFAEEKDLADRDEALLVDAAPDDLIDNAQGFSTDPIDSGRGFDPSPRPERSSEPEQEDS